MLPLMAHPAASAAVNAVLVVVAAVAELGGVEDGGVVAVERMASTAKCKKKVMQ